MKKILTFGICILSAAIGFSQEAIKPIPSLDQLDRVDIDINIAGLWSGQFYSDGSASLTFSPTDGVYLPEDSFSFEEIYNILVPHLKPFVWSHETMSVYFFLTDQVAMDLSFSLEDKDIMRKIMYGLCDKMLASPDVVFREKLFKELLRKYPLVPGDPPYLKADEEAGEGEVVRSKEEVVGDEGEVADNKEEVGRSKEEVGGAETPVAAKKAGRPSLLFYVGIGVLACVGAALFLTRKR